MSFDKQYCRGVSLLECVCSLALVGLLSAVLVQATHRSIQIFQLQAGQLEQRLAVMKTYLALGAALSMTERSHFEMVVSIANGSAPQASDGGPHPVSNLRGTSQPRADSSILSVLEVSPRYRGRIIASSFSGSSVTVRVCELGSIPTQDQFRSYLVLGVSGACQLSGSFTRQGSGCLELVGSNVKGLVRSDGCPPQSLLEFIPIERELSLFIDRTGELRLISHVGLKLLENQPIVRGLRSMMIHETRDTMGAVLYDVAIRATSSPEFSVTIPRGATVTSIWNEVLL